MCECRFHNQHLSTFCVFFSSPSWSKLPVTILASLHAEQFFIWLINVQESNRQQPNSQPRWRKKKGGGGILGKSWSKIGCLPCLTLTGDGWEKTTTLIKERYWLINIYKKQDFGRLFSEFSIYRKSSKETHPKIRPAENLTRLKGFSPKEPMETFGLRVETRKPEEP